MSVTKNGLRDLILSEINALSDEQRRTQLDVHTAVATGIESYLISNAEAGGAYVGTIPGPSPDPANGSYTWTVNQMTIDGSTLASSASGSFSGWVTAIETAIRSVQFNVADSTSVITLGAPVLLTAFDLSALAQGNLGQTDQRDTAWDIIAQAIIDALLVAIPQPSPTAAASTTPGSGQVTFVAVT